MNLTPADAVQATSHKPDVLFVPDGRGGNPYQDLLAKVSAPRVRKSDLPTIPTPHLPKGISIFDIGPNPHAFMPNLPA